ncbi:uncharacterized protein PpBr36_09932 [Pyricularia pennisetigena]|uniref:uncharacterized protein n=1 Tax=Pyricularia pennisetigena TaxID=1578925 RepID=UPI00115051DA|nr:uncharacterized protein PpBr36_09932 [Pyricularia pennisetigena]TLS22194.1 hypothetical protein PpBr36_09932 [Pyricularia pennisetigena]
MKWTSLQWQQDTIIIFKAISKLTDEGASLSNIGWYGSAYLLMVCAFDFISILMFDVGPAICGGAPSSKVLIVGRAIAGLGTAPVLTGAFVLIGIAIPAPLRPLYTGITGPVYGVFLLWPDLCWVVWLDDDGLLEKHGPAKGSDRTTLKK